MDNYFDVPETYIRETQKSVEAIDMLFKKNNLNADLCGDIKGIHSDKRLKLFKKKKLKKKKQIV